MGAGNKSTGVWTKEELEWLVECGRKCQENGVPVHANVPKLFKSRYDTHSDTGIRAKWEVLYLGNEDSRTRHEEYVKETQCLKAYLASCRKKEEEMAAKRERMRKLREERLRKVRASYGGYSVC